MHSLITITKASELFLACCIPAVEPDLPTVCVEIQRMHLHTNCSCYYEIIKRKLTINSTNKKKSEVADQNPHVRISSQTLQ